MKRALLAVVALAIFAVGCTEPVSDLGTTITGTTEKETAPEEVTAEMVVDALGATSEAKFCTALEDILVMGFSPNETYDIALTAFAEGYGTPAPGTPTARAVFDEFLSRCERDA